MRHPKSLVFAICSLCGWAALAQALPADTGSAPCPPAQLDIQSPPTHDQPVEVTFLIDCSGQSTVQGRDRATRVLLQTLTKMRSHDELRVAAFGNRVDALAEHALSPAEIDPAALAAWVQSRPASGGTNIEAALTWAVAADLASDSRGIVILLSDGRATLGERDSEALAKKIRQRNASGRVLAQADPESLESDALYHRVYSFVLSQRVEAIPAVPSPTPPNIDLIWSEVFKPDPNQPHPTRASLPWFDGSAGPLNAAQTNAVQNFVVDAARIEIRPTKYDARSVAPGVVVQPDIVVIHNDWQRFRDLKRHLGPARPGLALPRDEIIVRVGKITYLIRLMLWGC